MTEEERSKRGETVSAGLQMLANENTLWLLSLTGPTKALYTIFNEPTLIDVGNSSIQQPQPKQAGAAKEQQQVWRL